MSTPKPVILYAALPSGNSQKAILMCRLLALPFELRAPNGLIGADAETKQSPFLRLNPLGQVPVLVDPNAAPEPAAAHGLTGEPADAADECNARERARSSLGRLAVEESKEAQEVNGERKGASGARGR